MALPKILVLTAQLDSRRSASNVYLDISGLAGKAGTQATAVERDGQTVTANLNPSWAVCVRNLPVSRRRGWHGS